MAKRLRGVAHLFTGNRNLFGEDIQMISKAEHILKNADRLAEILFFVRTSLKDVSGSVNIGLWTDIPS
jgi:hypothetical protein